MLSRANWEKNYIDQQTGKYSTVFKIGNASDKESFTAVVITLQKNIINCKIQNTSTSMTRREKISLGWGKQKGLYKVKKTMKIQQVWNILKQIIKSTETN